MSFSQSFFPALLSELHDNHPILSEEYEADGTKVQVLLDAKDYNRLKAFMTE